MMDHHAFINIEKSFLNKRAQQQIPLLHLENWVKGQEDSRNRIIKMQYFKI